MTQLTPVEVGALLDRASAATASEDGIIAVVDRTGQILGVRVEAGVATPDLGFAIDGAVAKARTGAFFSNGQAILTSRTVSHISQSTNTQREVEANPASADPTVNGPGFVAPVGVGGQFPPGILRQPLVDLFAIEHTNRVSVVTGPGGATVVSRDAYAQQIAAPGTVTSTVARGIATLPGGLGIYRLGTNEVIGGIGVFFPGRDGTASFEQGFVPSAAQSRTARLNAPKALEAEAAALVALTPIAVFTTGGAVLPPLGVTLAPVEAINRAGGLGGLPPLSLPQAQGLITRVNAAARINLGGIALQTFGPQAGPLGVQTLFNIINASYGRGAVSGALLPVTSGGGLLLSGQPQPDGWLVPASASSCAGGLTAAQVTQLVNHGVLQAWKTRAQIRLQPTFAKMVIAVADRDGRLLAIAKRHTIFETLETRNRDSLDFHEVSAEGLRRALADAYEAGRAAATRDSGVRDRLLQLSPDSAGLLAAMANTYRTSGGPHLDRRSIRGLSPEAVRETLELAEADVTADGGDDARRLVADLKRSLGLA